MVKLINKPIKQIVAKDFQTYMIYESTKKIQPTLHPQKNFWWFTWKPPTLKEGRFRTWSWVPIMANQVKQSWKICTALHLANYHPTSKTMLSGSGWTNPSEKCESNWIISPRVRGENKEYVSCHHPAMIWIGIRTKNSGLKKKKNSFPAFLVKQLQFLGVKRTQLETNPFIEGHLSHEQKNPGSLTFHFTVCLVGILSMEMVLWFNPKGRNKFMWATRFIIGILIMVY